MLLSHVTPTSWDVLFWRSGTATKEQAAVALDRQLACRPQDHVRSPTRRRGRGGPTVDLAANIPVAGLADQVSSKRIRDASCGSAETTLLLRVLLGVDVPPSSVILKLDRWGLEPGLSC